MTLFDTSGIVNFINARDTLRHQKEAWENQPVDDCIRLTHREAGAVYSPSIHTTDPILQTYRFCNVRREDDRVTRWIRAHIIEPYAEDEHLWLMLAIARTFNWPPTLQRLMNGPGAWPDNPFFNPPRMTNVIQNIKDTVGKYHTGAYMVRAPGGKGDPHCAMTKHAYLCEVVLGDLWRDRAHAPWDSPSLKTKDVVTYLTDFTGWGNFMAYQVAVDLQHTRYLQHAADKNEWAAAGPGTIRGLNRLLNKDVEAPMRNDDAVRYLVELRRHLAEDKGLLAHLRPLDLSDVCNVCCEWDKYERVRLGQGKPRSKYTSERGF